MRYYIDVPDSHIIAGDGFCEWRNITTANSKEAAIAFIREHIDPSVDDDGNICLITEAGEEVENG